MTEPTDKRTDRPVMGDHPELDDDEEQRLGATQSESRFPRSFIIGGIVALVVIVALTIYLVVA